LVHRRNAKGDIETKSAGRPWIGWKLRNEVIGRTYLPLSQDVPRSEALYVEQDGERSALLRNPPCEVYRCEGADHTFSDASSRDAITARTLEWIARISQAC